MDIRGTAAADTAISRVAVGWAAPGLRDGVARFGAAMLMAVLCAGFADAALALTPVEVARTLDPSVVRLYVEGPRVKGSGTGFVVSDDGHVATNFHVVQQHVERGWTMSVDEGDGGSGKGLPVTLVEAFPGEDLAILHIEGLERPPVRFATTGPGGSTPNKGMEIFGIGFPGAADRLGPLGEASFAPGSISRIFQGSWSADGPPVTIIQHTSPTNPGNSGGPLVDACGRVIGINTQREARMILGPGGIPLVSDPIQGVFFSLDASVLLARLDQLGIPYRRATAADCGSAVSGHLDQWLPYLAALMVLIVGLGVYAMAFRPRPVVRVVVHCGGLLGDCARAVRRALDGVR